LRCRGWVLRGSGCSWPPLAKAIVEKVLAL